MRHSLSLTLCLCGSLGISLASAQVAAPTTPTWNPQTITSFDTLVTGVREVPRTRALPGLHLDAKVNGHVTDIYVAPMAYLGDVGMSFSKGDEVMVTGSVTRINGIDYLLTSEITLGRMTLCLRAGNGTPVWDPAL